LAEFDTEKLNDELERLYAALVDKPIGVKAIASSNAVSKIS